MCRLRKCLRLRVAPNAADLSCHNTDIILLHRSPSAMSHRQKQTAFLCWRSQIKIRACDATGAPSAPKRLNSDLRKLLSHSGNGHDAEKKLFILQKNNTKVLTENHTGRPYLQTGRKQHVSLDLFTTCCVYEGEINLMEQSVISILMLINMSLWLTIWAFQVLHCF